MRRSLEWILRNRTVVLVVLLAIVVLSLAGVRRLPFDWLPRLDLPVVTVISHQAGASAEVMELFVTRPIEESLRTIPGLSRLSSVSSSGISQVTVVLAEGSTLDDAHRLVSTALSTARARLPHGVEPWVESIGTTLDEICGYVVSGDSDLVELRNLVEIDIAGRIRSMDGVSRVDVIGGDRRSFDITVPPERLAALGITLDDIRVAVRNSIGASIVGYLEESGADYTVIADARIDSAEALEDVPVLVAGKRACLLGEVARVSEGRVRKHYTVHGSGAPGVAFLVRKHPGASTLRVARDVHSTVEALAPRLPPGTRIRRFYNQAEAVERAHRTVISNLSAGCILAIGVLLAFTLSLRSTLAVAATIPVTLLVTSGALSWLDLSLNVVTLSALTVSIGVIVDNAIVVAENITRRRQKGASPRRAAVEGTVEVAAPNLSGTLTTVAAFAPLVFVHGVAGLFLRPFGVTLSTALLVSLGFSLSVLPFWLRGRPSYSGARGVDGVGGRLLRASEGLGKKVASFGAHHRLGVLFVYLFLSGTAAAVGSQLRVGTLPPIDEGTILVEYIMPPGTALSESDALGDLLERLILSDPDVESTYRRTGSPEVGWQIEGAHRGEIMAKLRPANARDHDAEAVLDRMRQLTMEFEGVVFLHRQPTKEKIDESFSGLPSVFGVTVYGDDLGALTAAAAKVEEVLLSSEDIDNVINNTRVRRPELVVRIAHTALGRYGVTVEQVRGALRAILQGDKIVAFQRQRETVSVVLRVDRGGETAKDALRTILLRATGGAPPGDSMAATSGGHSGVVPLERVALFEVQRTPASVSRLNGRRGVTVAAELEGNVFRVVEKVKERLRALDFPDGTSYEVTGQYPVLLEMALELLGSVILAILVIYTILYLEFRSASLPLAVLAVVPISFAGAILLLRATGSGIDASVGTGLLTLVGISVNNAIVLIDFRNREMRTGRSGLHAISDAVAARLRPILMTSLTTIAALTPTALHFGAGSSVFQPFAVTVIGGLVAGTAATLLVLPALLAGGARAPLRGTRPQHGPRAYSIFRRRRPR